MTITPGELLETSIAQLQTLVASLGEQLDGSCAIDPNARTESGHIGNLNPQAAPTSASCHPVARYRALLIKN